MAKTTFSTLRLAIQEQFMAFSNTSTGNERAVFGTLIRFGVSRSFTHSDCLTAGAADTLRKVLEVGSIPRDLNNSALSLCYSMGWLHAGPLEAEASNVVCIFLTKLREKYAEYYLTLRNPQSYLLETYPSLPRLCEAVLRRSARKNIYFGGQMISGGQSHPQESLYQDEFHRSYVEAEALTA